MGILTDTYGLKLKIEKLGLKYDQTTMKAFQQMRTNPEKTNELIGKIKEIDVSKFDINKDGVFDKKELENLIVAMVTKGIVEGIQEFGTIEAFPKPKDFFAIRPAKEGELVETYVQNGILETSRVAKQGEYVIARCDENGDLILNSDGKPNEWIPDNADKTYNLDGGKDLGNGMSLVTKQPARRLFVQIPETMTIEAPWGGTMTLESGSVLRFDMGTGEVYGIATQEFIDTHDVSPMTKDMIISYDVLVDTLSKYNGNMETLNEILNTGDEVLNTDNVSFTKTNDELTPDKDNVNSEVPATNIDDDYDNR